MGIEKFRFYVTTNLLALHGVHADTVAAMVVDAFPLLMAGDPSSEFASLADVEEGVPSFPFIDCTSREYIHRADIFERSVSAVGSEGILRPVRGERRFTNLAHFVRCLCLEYRFRLQAHSIIKGSGSQTDVRVLGI